MVKARKLRLVTTDDDDSSTGLTPEQINEYYLEFERLLYRTESAHTYYEVLGLDRTATSEEVRKSYQDAVALLQPLYSGSFQSAPPDTGVRARKVLRTVSRAFSVLSSIAKRIDYDNSIFKRTVTDPLPVSIPPALKPAPLPVSIPTDFKPPASPTHSLFVQEPPALRTQSESNRPGLVPVHRLDLSPKGSKHQSAGGGSAAATAKTDSSLPVLKLDPAAPEPEVFLPNPVVTETQVEIPSDLRNTGDLAINIKIVNGQCFVKTEFSGETSEDNRRRVDRTSLKAAAKVTGHDRIRGQWEEEAETIDVSRLGMALKMRSRLRHGVVLHVTLPMPPTLRLHGFQDEMYSVYGIVRRISRPGEDGYRVIGLELLGEHPPGGFAERPWATIKTDKWNGPERRREGRSDMSEVVGIKYLNGSMEQIRQEVAVTENVSTGGARVYVKSAPSEFEYLKVTNLSRSFEGVAVVCNRFIGSDGFERICLQFVDKKWSV